MIAFIRPPERSSRSRRLRRVHRVLAETLLPPEPEPFEPGPPLVGWKAWLVVGWLSAAALLGVVHSIARWL
ncbi:MAG: hypothetical protein LLF97_02190 [Planctomycetaceae bacterium]|nr:hypothetical protein [Planctomycetaceae bacterium]